MDPIFKHPIFDSAREKLKHAIRQLEKPQEAFSGSFYTFFKCGSNNIFSVAKQVRSADEETSVFIYKFLFIRIRYEDTLVDFKILY